MAYRHGFRSEAERLAEITRRELGLGLYARLEPMQLAADLEIPVWSLTGLAGQPRGQSDLAAAIDVLGGPEQGALSAFTIFVGPRRVIVHNDSHAPGRQSSNLAHELAHALLLHPARPALDRRGCRDWNADIEDEANFLGGALLIPAKAAWWIAKRRQPFDLAAKEYGCSIEMVRWRVNVTGARRLLTG